MKNKWIILVIALSLVAIVGIGGKYFMDERTKTKEKELIEVERQSVVALKKTFSDIKHVTFEKSNFDRIVGTYTMFVTMTNNKNEFVSFSYGFVNSREKISAYPILDSSVQKEGQTASKVSVTYSNGEKGEI